MRIKKLLLPFFLLFVVCANAQLLSWTPDFIQESSSSVVITMDANYGNKGLLNYTPTTDVYVHIGVITNLSSSSSDWKYVKFSWGTTTAAAQCVYLGSNKWKYTINGGLRSFFGISNSSETIQKIAILFRSGNGNTVQRNADGSDMYVPVYDNGVYARIDVPLQQPTYYPIPEPVAKNVGDPLAITMKSSVSGALSIMFNGTQISSGSGTTLSVNTTIAVGGPQTIIAKAVSGSTAYDTSTFIVTPTVTTAPIPVGDTDGINYEQGDTSVVLVLYAPLKNYIYVEGDFNNWQLSSKYLMNVTPDKQRFWIRITGLQKGTEYAYQYLIDGSLKVADYNCEKILDPDNDPYISSSTYPNLKAYPTGKTTGIVSVLQTAKQAYNWQINNFNRPNKQNLVIYELLVRDFTAAGNFQTLIDTLSYLQRLGVNAIEVMPFNEFEGNSSWGYNPDFYFAPDKAYGPENVVKQFIDACHQRGIAVIMDMVMNHSFGQSPMVQMYWDSTLNVPAANSPWFNQYAKHAYNVGYDFNHESTATQDFVHRVINFWLTNYKIDGFRWDLAKGFTQKQTCDNTGNNCDVNAWGQYDQSRIDIWEKYYGYMQAASTNSYCILEMFADDSEQKVESADGMMLWGNENYNYNQATMGYKDGWDFNYGLYTSHGFADPNLVTYQESHDEERLMYKNEQYGAASGSYNVKNIPTGLSRNGMAAAFWATQPGPKMLWEFGELGYDLSINRCTDGTVNSNCRLDPKPPHWEYYNDANRKALYDVYADLIHLKLYPDYASTFINGTTAYNLSDTIKWQSISGSNLQVMVFGNFGIKAKTATVTFPTTGKWYSYLTDGNITVSSTSYTVTLQPGEYYVYTNKDVKGTVLAVEWLNFSAQKNGMHSVFLNWSVQSSVNNDHYEIERSNDGVHFTKIGTVNVVNGANMKKYSFTDNLPLSGINYYRIKQIDKDGSYQYSEIKKVNMADAIKRWNVYPNPAKDKATLYPLNNYTKTDIAVCNLNGKIVYHTSVSNVMANQSINIPVGNLSKGVYVIKIVTDKNTDTQKLVVE
ncbi:MAG: T9SS type A sorting domain-containing protein [Bacteroidetes bacterium]|nr:T9SS type A sorting domain-containing protein [Bacteroidota bacterium]